LVLSLAGCGGAPARIETWHPGPDFRRELSPREAVEFAELADDFVNDHPRDEYLEPQLMDGDEIFTEVRRGQKCVRLSRPVIPGGEVSPLERRLFDLAMPHLDAGIRRRAGWWAMAAGDR
jgi:hypothetical protein